MNKSNVGASLDTIHFLIDIVMLVISFVITVILFHDELTEEQVIVLFLLELIYGIIYLLSNRDERLYNITVFFYLDRVLKKVFKSFLVGAVSTSAIMFYIDAIKFDHRIYLFFLCFSFVVLLITTFCYRYFIMHTNMRRFRPRTAFVGKVDSFEKFMYFLNKTSIRVEDIGYISMDDEEDDMSLYIGKLENLDELIREHNIDQIYIMQKQEADPEYIQEYIDLCMEMGVTCRVIVDFYKRRRANSYVSSVGTYPVITYHTISLNNYETIIKRTMDIVGSIVGIILSSPIMLIAAIAIKLDSPGPVIFKQVRVGQNGRHFKIYKFRSMYIDAEARKAELMSQNEMSGGVMFKMKDDPRVTKVGKFIRKTSIDELPQFFNVFIGNMSLVGTRPPTVDEVEKYERDQWRRISIKPGITGMWQVSGRSNVESFEDVVQMDVDYIDNWSIFEDIKIIFRTFLVILHRDGAY